VLPGDEMLKEMEEQGRALSTDSSRLCRTSVTNHLTAGGQPSVCRTSLIVYRSSALCFDQLT